MKSLSGQERKTVLDELFILREYRALDNPVTAIYSIIEQRVADGLQVSPDLMRPASLQLAFDQRNIAQTLQNFIVCHGPLSLIRIVIYRHNLAILDATTYVSRNAAVFRYISPYQRDVPAGYTMIEKLFC